MPLRRYHDFMERRHAIAKHRGSRRIYFDLMTPIFAVGFVVMLVFRQWIAAALFAVCVMGGWAYLHDDPRSFWHSLVVRTRKRTRL